ncbi:hypothetical protein GGX14DRAFT_193404 [Mycena pura]|uniref:Uncharacterized protein n=1 Tax=Mycena pura TaxID=153505 RepID=A0AAD6YKQ2_9AGAR|nr:hypothetical protein GGX14DRAFT_193404 [Mycena pura]
MNRALSATVAMTALTTVSVNLFYAWRIHKMSKNNWWITAPICLLCLARTGLAFVTTTEMILTKTFAKFAASFNVCLSRSNAEGVLIPRNRLSSPADWPFQQPRILSSRARDTIIFAILSRDTQELKK